VILVDTSVWVEHLRRGHPALVALLEQGQVVCHPFVIGEVGLGSLRRRREILELLAELPALAVVSHEEALALVERHGLAGRGIGWIDVHLSASALVGGCRLWTLDTRLVSVARDLDLAWAPSAHP
jgi:hypothetical protein